VKRSLKGAALACHPGPTALLTLIAYLLSSQLVSRTSALGIALSVFLGQLVIGWSNDLVDLASDRASNRSEKPLVAQLISENSLRRSMWITAVLAVVINLLGPLGIKGGLTHYSASHVELVTTCTLNERCSRGCHMLLPSQLFLPPP
jgi:Ca2+/Na+ antiporter